jgi:hypothetical protein
MWSTTNKEFLQMAKGDNTTAGAAPKKARRTVKPKDVFMIFEGQAPANVSFTKDALAVLEACSGNSGKSYIKVTLPAPTPRAKAGA